MKGQNNKKNKLKDQNVKNDKHIQSAYLVFTFQPFFIKGGLNNQMPDIACVVLMTRLGNLALPLFEIGHLAQSCYGVYISQDF